MPRRKPTPERARRSRSGPTQPEHMRKRQQWLLRVRPEVRELARARAARLGVDVSSYVEGLVERDARQAK